MKINIQKDSLREIVYFPLSREEKVSCYIAYYGLIFHELCHAIAALALFCPISEFKVVGRHEYRGSDDWDFKVKGCVTYSCNDKNLLTLLFVACAPTIGTIVVFILCPVLIPILYKHRRFLMCGEEDKQQIKEYWSRLRS